MPEGPELAYMGELVGRLAAGRLFTAVSISALASSPRKHPAVIIPARREWQQFTIRTEARGKECRLILSPHLRGKHLSRNSSGNTITIRFRAGMVRAAAN